ncbi:hypothetical protein L6227_02805 [Pseudomonas syringae pv. syringae]|uniref:hypothetical protein n=1 Tax=Pseudomonas syringae TaxID=317 RepID=UPI0004E702CB|nr:hypothetical protein [Pseudomonas syringae]KFF82314.1 hypothetical protein HM80_17750 [Pseudomonas syringae pv. syringae]MCH5548226.1 hypothetical protein [Pseudomonas syringae pv. syringae]MCH5568813.1 hypothetical protein [Pseudomonas syringae pv. syringae]MEE5162201.1 hypothetical protein [Pseudomonas alliivorans]
MANQDLFKPSISLWQHYITIVAVGLACWMNSVTGGIVAIAVLVIGAALEGVIQAYQGRGRQ